MVTPIVAQVPQMVTSYQHGDTLTVTIVSSYTIVSTLDSTTTAGDLIRYRSSGHFSTRAPCH